MLTLGIVILFWYLPRLIDLQQIPGDVPAAEGPANDDDLQLRFDYRNWQKSEESSNQGEDNFVLFVLLCALVALAGIILVLWAK